MKDEAHDIYTIYQFNRQVYHAMVQSCKSATDLLAAHSKVKKGMTDHRFTRCITRKLYEDPRAGKKNENYTCAYKDVQNVAFQMGKAW